MEKNEEYVKQGERFKALLEEKGYTPYSFSKKAMYSNARMYKLLNGDCDLLSIKVYNALIFARILGYQTIDEFYEALHIDFLKDVL